jgi:hypothetical protein
MTMKTAAAAIALLITTSPLAYAAETSSTSTVGMRHPNDADMTKLTDMRVGVVKSALQMTPDQEKLWPPVEAAIRARAKNRQARMERLAELHENAATDALGGHSPIELMQHRADRLIQRGNDMKKLAEAWEPLYKTLNEDQRKRMAFVSIVAWRGMRDMMEHSAESADDDDE